MTTRYVWSGATGANNGTSWADAYTALASATVASTGGDTILISHTHYETFASGNVTYYFSTNPSNPVIVVSVDKATNLPLPGARISHIGTTVTLSFEWSAVFYGLTAGIDTTASTNSNLKFGYIGGATVSLQRHVDCTYTNLCAGASSTIVFGNSSNNPPSGFVLDNVDITYSKSPIQVINSRFDWTGGTVHTSQPSTVTGILRVASSGEGHDIYINNVDLSDLPAGSNIVSGTISQAGTIRLVDCKLPSEWSGVLQEAAAVGCVATMTNCGYSGVDLTRTSRYSGIIRNDTSVLKGSETLSWAILSSSECNKYNSALKADSIVLFKPAGTYTITVEFAHNHSDLLDNEIWFEASGSYEVDTPISYSVSTAPTILSTGTALETSSETWSGSPTTKQKMSVTITTARECNIYVDIFLGSPNKTIYICPNVTVS